MKIKIRYVYRSSITGKFVSEQYALKNPETTYRVEVKVRK